MQIYTANLGVQLFLFTIAAVTFLRFACFCLLHAECLAMGLGHTSVLSAARPARLSLNWVLNLVFTCAGMRGTIGLWASVTITSCTTSSPQPACCRSATFLLLPAATPIE